MDKFTDESSGKSEIDGFPCIERIQFDDFENKMSVKADEYYIYIPMFDRHDHTTTAFYLKIDKRLFQIGEVQR